MKALIFVVAVGFTACGGLAQGQFSFGNKDLTTTPPMDARVLLPYGASAAGVVCWTQAYIKRATDPESSFMPAGTVANFRTGNNAGSIVPVVITAPFPGGTTIHVQMRAWDAALGTSHVAAVATRDPGRVSGSPPLCC